MRTKCRACAGKGMVKVFRTVTIGSISIPKIDMQVFEGFQKCISCHGNGSIVVK